MQTTAEFINEIASKFYDQIQPLLTTEATYKEIQSWLKNYYPLHCNNMWTSLVETEYYKILEHEQEIEMGIQCKHLLGEV